MGTKNCGQNKSKARVASGFTLAELAIAMAIISIVAAMALPSLGPALANQRSQQGYSIVYNQLKLAQNLAMSNRHLYRVQILKTGNGQQASVRIDSGMLSQTSTIPGTATSSGYLYEPVGPPMTLPFDVQFMAPSVLPTPDNFGVGTTAIDLSVPTSPDPTTVYFAANGQALNAEFGSPVSGVVYTCGEDFSNCHAVTLWGQTGHINGWILVQSGKQSTWVRDN
jgi:prepilin-type N-terminal cleavage/methylation domain-containing protein